MSHEQLVQSTCEHAFKVINITKLRFRPMIRKNNRVNTKRSYVIGRTNLKTGLITIDIFTPRRREPKSIASILRTLCHEIAHHQRLPFRQLYKWRWITRQHYPEFYDQVNKNILILKEDKILGTHFV